MAGLLVAVVALAALGPLAGTSRATAQPASPSTGPRCPAAVADQPLSVTEPFSGTIRPRADGEGGIGSSSLLCAYGEGAAPAAEVTVRWTAGSAPCATTEVAVAPGLDGAAFDAVASTLASSAGTACGASSAGGWPLGVVAAGLVGGAVLAALAALRIRRRRPARTVSPPPAVIPAEVTPLPRSAPEPTPAPTAVVAARRPDARPVLAALRGPGGRDFARTGAGQLAALAALAYLSGDSVGGDLARAGSLAVLPVPLPTQAEGVAAAEARAHHGRGADR